MFERFTDPARQVLVTAQVEARLLDHPLIGTEHLLLGLIQDEGGVAGLVLTELGLNLSAARTRAQESIHPPGGPGHMPLPFTPRAKKVMELALRDAVQLGSQNIGTEHLLLGLVREGEGVAVQIMTDLGVVLPSVRQVVIQKLVEQRDEATTTPAAPQGQRTRAQSRRPDQARLVKCSFCGKHPPESGGMIAGNNAYICQHCIVHWSVHFRTPGGTLPDQAWRETVSPGEPPADEEQAREDIRTAFANYGERSDDGTAALWIEGGASLGWTHDVARENASELLDREFVFAAEEITFVDPEHAAVRFSIYIDGRPVLSRHRGDAVLVADTWLIARATFVDVMRMGGVTVPPD